MKNNSKKSILLVGAGPMAIDYSFVLRAMQIPFIVVGRGENSAKTFKKKTNLPIEIGGIEKWFKNNNLCPKYSIVAVNGTELGNVARLLLKKGVKNILLEKPGGLDKGDIESVCIETKRNKANVMIAYNRHYYASIIKAKEIIKKDGGVSSFIFEFTEWSHKIEKLDKDGEILNRWLLHNSTHVIDLAFYLGGEPAEIQSFSGGELKWHPPGSVFTGVGKTKEGKLFSYHSNWDAPGRWGVEILTKNYRLILRPLEKLKIQKKGSIKINEVEIDDKLDVKFKPGLYKQVEAFLNDNFSEFVDIYQQVKNMKFYYTIMKGNSFIQ